MSVGFESTVHGLTSRAETYTEVESGEVGPVPSRWMPRQCRAFLFSTHPRRKRNEMKQLITAVLIWLAMVVPSAAQTPEWRPSVLDVVSFSAHGADVSTSKEEWKKAVVHAAIAAGIVVHACDLSTTSWALGKAGDQYREANPALRWASDDPVKLAIAKMGLAVAVSYGVIQLHKEHPKWALAAAITQVVVVGYVAHRNAAQIRQDSK